MCDTLACLPAFTKNGNLIFAKNSDREPDEAQEILHIPRTAQKEQALSCTFITIPQVKETYEVMLSKPFQMWGAEMGVNEFGLVIGNEAVFTNVKIARKNDGLTGMDMLRLALERTKSAEEAVQCITTLLAAHGQDACGGYRNQKFFYHNSFIIADSLQAFILETAGKSWALKEIRSYGSISNGLSIDTVYDKVHLGKEKKFFPYNLKSKPVPFSFSGYFSEYLYTKVGRAKSRRSCSMALLEAAQRNLDVEKTLSILQTHNLPDPDFSPKKANTASLCMHATGLTNPSQTTGSMVAEIRGEKPSTIWLTGTSMPCLSVYIPFFMGTNTLQNFRKPSESPDDSLWWKAEKLHRWICKDYQERKQNILPTLQRMQEGFIKEEFRLIQSQAKTEALEAFSNKCLDEVITFYNEGIG